MTSDNVSTENNKVSKKLTKKDLNIMVGIQQNFHRFVSEFFEEQDNNSDIETVLQNWKEQTTQNQVLGLLKFCTTTTPTNRTRRDPKAPVRPRSAFVFFGKAKRERMKKKYSDKTGSQITKLLSAKWALLSDKKRKKFEILAEKDKERYAEQMKTYVPSTPEELSTPRKRGRPPTKKKREGPKRARTAYILFCTEMRPVVRESKPDLTGREITKEMARMWKDDYPTKTDRKKWRKLAKEDKKRYEREKEEWEAEKAKLPDVKTIESSESGSESESEPVAVRNAKRKVRKESKKRQQAG